MKYLFIFTILFSLMFGLVAQAQESPLAQIDPSLSLEDPQPSKYDYLEDFKNSLLEDTYLLPGDADLRQRLQPITDVIETHPLVDFVFLSGNPKDVEVLRRRKSDSAIQWRILSRYVKNLPEGLNDDQYDAVIAAMVACAYSGGVGFDSIAEAL